jgi:hypothetical protein
MHPTLRLSEIRRRANQEPELTQVIADALGWEVIEVGELLAGEFDLQRSEVKVIVHAVAEFDRMRTSVVSQRA